MADLRDLRAKVTVEADAVLDAESRVTGKDRSEIVRDVLHARASERIEVSTVLRARLEAEGIAVARKGMPGSEG